MINHLISIRIHNMPNKIYCQSCYKPTLYESTKPNLCSFCGKPFVNTSNASILENKKTQIKKTDSYINIARNINEDDEESDNIDHVPSISKLDIEITGDLRFNRETVGKATDVLGKKTNTLVGKNPEDILKPEQIRPRTKSKKISKQQIEKQWKESFPPSVKNIPGKTISVDVNPKDK